MPPVTKKLFKKICFRLYKGGGCCCCCMKLVMHLCVPHCNEAGKGGVQLVHLLGKLKLNLLHLYFNPHYYIILVFVIIFHLSESDKQVT